LYKYNFILQLQYHFPVKILDKKKCILQHTEYLAAALSIIYNVPCFMERLERSHTRCLLSNDDVPLLCWSRIDHCVEHISVLEKVHTLNYNVGAWYMSLSETVRESVVLLVWLSCNAQKGLQYVANNTNAFWNVEILFFIPYGKNIFCHEISLGNDRITKGTN